MCEKGVPAFFIIWEIACKVWYKVDLIPVGFVSGTFFNDALSFMSKLPLGNST